ncbi:hypothetical protein BGZ58_004455 [Dissophora ornata]|nr:hypothetical protein BGZ58_004455 [Dissophora ornata]
MAAMGDFGFDIHADYNSQHPLSSPMFSESSSSSSSPNDFLGGFATFDHHTLQGEHCEEDALSMELFGSPELDFGLSGPSSTFDGSMSNGPSLPDSPSGPTAEPSGPSLPMTKHVPKPLDLSLTANMPMIPDSLPSAAMSMATTDSPSPTQSCSPSPSAPSSPLSPSYEDILQPVVACANCKRSHIKCDHGRPCQNCLKHPTKASTCRDAVPKPRGRPKGGSKVAVIDSMMALRLQQHPGFQPFSGGSFLQLHGQAEQVSPHRQRAMSIPHISPYDPAFQSMMQEHQQQEFLLQHQQEQHRPQFHQRTVSNGHPSMAGHPFSPSPWGSSGPGIPEMSTISEMPATPTHPMALETVQSPVGFPAGLDAYEIHQLQQHRQHLQQHQQMQQQRHSQPPSQKVSDPHTVGMTRSLSEHFGPQAPVRHFHNEHHQQFLKQQPPQHPYQRPRPHPGHSLTLMIPSTNNGRLVVSAGPSPVSAGFPVSPGFPGSPSPAMVPSVPASPAIPLQSPTHPYLHQHHHSHHALHLQQQQPLSPMSHGPVADGHGDNASMKRLLLQELEIKHDLEMYEQQGYQKQQELVRINMQKMQLHHQHQQHQLAMQQDQTGRNRFYRRSSLQFGMTSNSGLLSGPTLPSVQDDEMVGIDG